jgi:hypothetical protein
MIEDPDLPLTPNELWYNGFEQLKSLTPPGDLVPFGFKGGDDYSKALAAKDWPVNERFGGRAILVGDDPVKITVGGLNLTLLSPNRAKLERLRSEWIKWRSPVATADQPQTGSPNLHAFGKRPMPAVLDVEMLSAPSNLDKTAPNGSSIAFIAEYEGRSVLLGADAHSDALLNSLVALADGDSKVKVDIIKLPHHASRANVTRSLVESVDCNRFAVSTSGAVFGHPDPEAISRVLKFGNPNLKTLYFNYASERTRPWDDASLQSQYGYECVYPEAEGEPLVIAV